VVADYVDNDISASTRSAKPRPQFQQMVADAREGKFSIILAYTSGRLTRRMRENEDLIELAEKHGISYEYLRSPSFDLNTSEGRRVARILAANDAAEAEIISERVARARLQQAQQGRFGGGARRYGHNLDGTIREDEAVIVKESAEKLLAGVGLRGIIRDLNARGTPAPRGGGWAHSAMRDLLLQARLAGLMAFSGEVIEDAPPFWNPILDRQTWEAAVALLRNPDRRVTPGPIPKHLLSHLALCGHPSHPENDRPVLVHGWSGGGQWRVPSYKCITQVGHLSCASGGLDNYVEAVVIERLSRPDAAELLIARPDVDASALAREANNVRARLVTLGDLVESGDMSPGEYRQRKVRLFEKLAGIEAKLTAAAGTSPLVGIVGRRDAADVWKKLDLGRRKAIVDALMVVVVLPAQQRGKGFNPGRVLINPRA
jgi:DNA invertase Pin-like site-specific DNA recombinase